MAKILMGPVVGHVTCTTAIILLEVDKAVTLECLLYEDGESANKYKTATTTFPAKTARVFQFDNLTEGKKYKFTVPKIHGDKILGSFKTFPTDPKTLRVAAVSCDEPKQQSGDMWPTLASEVHDINLCLHLGDNVYIDEGSYGPNMELTDEYLFDPEKIDQNIPYVRARKLLKDKTQEEWPQFDAQIREIYKEKYRNVWMRENKCYVLANTSNLMILDDHEARDDFGSFDVDYDPNSKEFFITAIAISLYHEYQRQLWDPDIVKEGATDKLYNEFFSIQQGPLLITMMESRTSESIYKSKRDKGDDSYFGKQQLDSFTKAVKNAESNSRILLVNCAMPLFFMKATLTRLFVNLGDDFKGFIQHDIKHPGDKPSQELLTVIDAIKDWKDVCNEKSPSAALVVAGDIHMGGFTDIYTEDKKQLVCRQISSGAISLKEKSIWEFGFLRGAMNFTDTYENYGYHHYNWTKNCNYALMNFVLDEKSLNYSVSLKHTSGVSEYRSVIDGENKEEFWDN